MSLEKNIRRENLLRILESHFSGNRNQLAIKLHIAIPTLNKYLSNGKTGREISDSKARHFERHLGLSPKALEQKNKDQANLYYVKIGFSASKVNQLLEKLYQFEVIQEASAQYGETDIFLKIEATEEEMRKLVFERIRVLPGVYSTNTSQVLAHSHWQREQLSRYDVYTDNSSPQDLLSIFIQDKNKALYKEIEALEKGDQVIIGNDDYHTIDYLQLLSHTHNRIRMTKRFQKHLKKEEIKKFEDDIYQEAQYIASDALLNFLIIIDKATSEEMQATLKKMLDNLPVAKNKIIRIMHEEGWISSRYQHEAEHFTIFDKQLVSIMGRKSITLRYSQPIVEHYTTVFEKNWRNASYSGYWYSQPPYD